MKLLSLFFSFIICLCALEANTHHSIPKHLASINSAGGALFNYQNQSGLSNDAVFIQVIGTNPTTGYQAFIQYDASGNPSYVDVKSKMDSQAYCYPLSSFTITGDGNGHMLYLPALISSRIYTSVGKKITLPVNQNEKGQWTISGPDPLNPSDPNKDFLWDKTEFTLNASDIFINPTAVDSFSLPLRCQEFAKDGSTKAGGIGAPRTTIFRALQEAFNDAGGPWPKLLWTTPSLSFAPFYAAAVGIFPNDFFVTSGFITAFCDLYSTTPIIVDVSESLPPNLGGGIWRGTIDSNTKVITFNRDVDATHPAINPQSVTLPTATHGLISGDGTAWGATNEVQRIFARNISVAIDTNTLSKTAALNKQYFISQNQNFYKANSEMPGNLQFIDCYSLVLHSFGDHHVYTIPYDDEAGQAGAVSLPPSNFAYGVITLYPIN